MLCKWTSSGVHIGNQMDGHAMRLCLDRWVLDVNKPCDSDGTACIRIDLLICYRKENTLRWSVAVERDLILKSWYTATATDNADCDASCAFASMPKAVSEATEVSQFMGNEVGRSVLTWLKSQKMLRNQPCRLVSVMFTSHT